MNDEIKKKSISKKEPKKITIKKNKSQNSHENHMIKEEKKKLKKK